MHTVNNSYLHELKNQEATYLQGFQQFDYG